jgi:two-component system, chemotaxis family, sensor kinase CheA
VDLSEFLDLFLTESREHLEEMSRLLLRCRSGVLGSEEINDLFRHAHSLKGMAASMGFTAVRDLAHAMEDAFHVWRDRGPAPAGEQLETLLRAGDRLAAQVDAIAAGGEAPVETELVASLRSGPEGREAGAAAQTPEAAPPGPEAPPAAPLQTARSPEAERSPEAATPALQVEVSIAPTAPLPAARALVVLKRLEEMGQVLDVSPAKESIGSARFGGRLRLRLATRLAPARIRSAILELPDVEACDVGLAQADRRHGDRRRTLEDDLRSSPSVEGSPRRPEPGSEGTPRPEAIGSIRVSTERMDRLLDGIGELILDRERLKRALAARPSSTEVEVLESLARTVESLRDEVVAMRMLPFGSLVPRLQRMVRDLARRLDKPIELTVQGNEVSLDRSILEEMMDPLEHILRNSIDHGIEAGAERRAAGKPAEGRIEIVLAPRESRVTLTVEDDGRGIEPAALRRVAVERRFLTREAAERLSDEESLMLITLPGFSTASKTTDISGRGVGMDVVLTQVRKLGGRLTVRSRVGFGTRFEMDLPPTITVTRAFLCRDAGEIYAVPVSVVEHTLEVRRESLQQSRGEQIVQRADEVITVLPLRGLLRGETSAEMPPSVPALLYREGKRSIALVVDEILGEVEIVVKPLRHPLELLPQYAGAAILNTGQIALILDPANLARLARAA